MAGLTTLAPPRVTHLERARATRAIIIAQAVLPGPVARLVAEQITWDLDSALGDRGRATALVEAVLGLVPDTPNPKEL